MNNLDSSSDGQWSGQGHREHGSGDELGAPDAQALDALVEAGWDVQRVPAEMRTRAERIVGVLGMLGGVGIGGTELEESLVDATLARLHKLRSAPPVPVGEEQLLPVDDDALEALVSGGFDPARVPAAVRNRAKHQLNILSLLDSSDAAAGSGDLVGRTLAHVQQSIDKEESKRSVVVERGRRFVGLRVGDLVSVAAMLLIATAVIGPMLGGVRDYSRRLSCQSNMNAAGLGFGAYAGDNKDALPLASASVAGNPWWFVGRNPEQSNSANLYTLARTEHAKLDDLSCCGNRCAARGKPKMGAMDWASLDEVSYSYQNMFARERPRWSETSRMVVLVDCSPVVRQAWENQQRALNGQSPKFVNPLDNSRNHGGRGQNVLFNDGASVWMTSPVLPSGDNIWLPRVLEDVIARLKDPTQAKPLHGDESPDGPNDAFVGP